MCWAVASSVVPCVEGKPFRAIAVMRETILTASSLQYSLTPPIAQDMRIGIRQPGSLSAARGGGQRQTEPFWVLPLSHSSDRLMGTGYPQQAQEADNGNLADDGITVDHEGDATAHQGCFDQIGHSHTTTF